MTIGVVLVGTLLFLTMKKWVESAFYTREQDLFNYVYDYAYEGLIKGSHLLTRVQITGRLRDYFLYMCTFIVFLVLYTLFKYDAFAIGTQYVSEIEPYMWIVALFRL